MTVPRRTIRKFESVRESVRYAESKARAGWTSHEYGSGFTGTDTFQEAVDLAMNGWSTERPKVDALLEPLRERLAEKLDLVSHRIHDIVGYEPDIDRFLDGEMESMWEDIHIEAPHQGKVFTLLVSGSVSGGVSTETILKRGVAIIALVEAFQICGCDLEIWVENSVTSFDYQRDAEGSYCPEWSSLTRVHRAGDNLDINELMFPLGHPAWQRRLSFGMREGEPQEVRDSFGFNNHGGMGSTADLLCVDVVNPSFTITRGGTSRHSQLLDRDPLAWILSTLEDQGVYNNDEERV